MSVEVVMEGMISAWVANATIAAAKSPNKYVFLMASGNSRYPVPFFVVESTGIFSSQFSVSAI
jgi:hypothetical protein